MCVYICVIYSVGLIYSIDCKKWFSSSVFLSCFGVQISKNSKNQDTCTWQAKSLKILSLVFWKKVSNWSVFCLKQEYLTKGVRTIYFVQRKNKFIVLTPLADIFLFLSINSLNLNKDNMSFCFWSKCILILEFLDIFTGQQDKNN